MEFIIITRWPLTNADRRWIEEQLQQRWPGAYVVVSEVRDTPRAGPSEVKQDTTDAPYQWPSQWWK